MATATRKNEVEVLVAKPTYFAVVLVARPTNFATSSNEADVIGWIGASANGMVCCSFGNYGVATIVMQKCNHE